jgi:hypothetical protein
MLGGEQMLRPGQRVRISGTIENRLLPGKYFVSAWISRNRTQGDLALHIMRLLDFVVYGTRPGPGSVSVEADVEATIEPEERAAMVEPEMGATTIEPEQDASDTTTRAEGSE